MHEEHRPIPQGAPTGDPQPDRPRRWSQLAIWLMTPASIVLFPLTVQLLIWSETIGRPRGPDTAMGAFFDGLAMHIGLAVMLEVATLAWAIVRRKEQARSWALLAGTFAARFVLLPALGLAVVLLME